MWPRSSVAVLTRHSVSANVVHRNLALAHKEIVRTPLDNATTPWAVLFRKILYVVLRRDETNFELLEQHLDSGLHRGQFGRTMALLDRIEQTARRDPSLLRSDISLFVDVAEEVLPVHPSKTAVSTLRSVLGDIRMLDSFIPARPEQVQLMTLHKAKGLEFQMVFHLDLYDGTLPDYRCRAEREFVQELNLHYVGITRASKCCVLCWSTRKHFGRKGTGSAKPSPFLSRHRLPEPRLPSPV